MQRANEYSAPAALEILLIEDSPVDIVLFKHLLRRTSVLYSLAVSDDGLDAVERLKNSGSGQPHYRPDVIFLDLNLPGKSGLEVLAEIKADPALASVPVAVLTGSDHAEDRSACSSLGASAYWNKTIAAQDFFALAAEIERFLAELPRVKPPELLRRFSAVSAA